MAEDSAPYAVKYLDGDGEETTWISRAGRAEVTYTNGHVYVGDFDQSKRRHGRGKYTWTLPPVEDEEEEEESKKPAVYEGEYRNGVRSGIGRLFPMVACTMVSGQTIAWKERAAIDILMVISTVGSSTKARRKVPASISSNIVAVC